MWQIPVLIIIIGAAALLTGQRTVLEKNLDRLTEMLKTEHHKIVAVIGQSGAGKSTLLLKLSSNKIKPRPRIGIETDATNWSEDEGCTLICRYRSIAFIDVPGYDTESHPVDPFLESFPFDYVDKYVFVFNSKIRQSDEDMLARIIETAKPLCIVRSFEESLDSDDKITIKEDIKKRADIGTSHFMFVSSRKGTGIKKLHNFMMNK